MKRGSKGNLIVYGAIILLCAGLPTAVWVALTSGPEGLGAGIAAYHKARLPWAASELQSPVPADEDGAPTLIQAFEAFDRLRAYAESNKILDALDSGDLEFAEHHLEAFSRPLDLIAQGVQKPHAVFPKDWDLGAFVEFPEYETAKTAVKLLCVRARIKAKRGDFAGSCADLDTASALADRMGEAPTLIGVLVQLTDRRIIFEAMEHCAAVYSGHLAPEKALQASLAKISGTPDLVAASRGEAYMMLATLRNYSQLQSRIRADDIDSSDIPPINQARLIRSGDPGGLQVDLFGGPVLLNLTKFAEIAARDRNDPKHFCTDERARDAVLITQVGPRYYLADRLTSVFSNIGVSVLSDSAESCTLKALLEAEIMKAETGRYPRAISDLPSKWIDPCDGKPLRMIVGRNSIRIYSVGPDMTDDHGKTSFESHFSTHYDIVAGNPPPARRTVPKKKTTGRTALPAGSP